MDTLVLIQLLLNVGMLVLVQLLLNVDMLVLVQLFLNVDICGDLMWIFAITRCRYVGVGTAIT